MKVEDIKVGMKVKVVKAIKEPKEFITAVIGKIGVVTCIDEDNEWGYFITVEMEDGEIIFAAEELEKV